MFRISVDDSATDAACILILQVPRKPESQKLCVATYSLPFPLPPFLTVRHREPPGPFYPFSCLIFLGLPTSLLFVRSSRAGSGPILASFLPGGAVCTMTMLALVRTSLLPGGGRGARGWLRRPGEPRLSLPLPTTLARTRAHILLTHTPTHPHASARGAS